MILLRSPNQCGAWSRKRKIKSRALVHLRIGPNSPAMLLHDALNGGQPDAASFEIVLAMKALKDAKELVGILHAEPHAVVPHREDHFAVLAPSPNLDERPLRVRVT